MPKTKFEEFIFTLITSGIMIFIMGVYNIAINTAGLEYSTFVYELHSFPFEWLIGFVLAYFVASKIAKKLTFKIVLPQDRAIIKILCIQTFTVCTMVPLMSFMGTVESSGFTINIIVVWLQTVVLNFIMAYPLQIFIAGPISRFIFRIIFRKEDMEKIENNMIKDGFAE